MKIYKYIYICFSVSQIYTIIFSGSITVSFLSFVLFMVLSLLFLNNERKKDSELFILAGCVIYLSYVLRIPLLNAYPEYYRYSLSFGSISQSLIATYIFHVILFTLFLYLGMRLGNKKIKFNKSVFKNNFITTAQAVFDVYLILFVLFKIYTIFVLGVGVRGESGNTSVAFLSRFLTEPLFLAIITYSFVSRKRKSNKYLLILALYAFSMLGSGSKAFLIQIIMGFFLAYIIIYKNYEIDLARYVPLTLAIVFISLLTFFFAQYYRTYVILNDSGASLSSIADLAYQFVSIDNILSVYDKFTQRLIGMDGLIATMQYESSLVSKTVELKHIFASIVEQLIPYFSFGNVESIGKAISVSYVGLSTDASHAGALGLLGILKLSVGVYLIPLFSFIIGLMVSFGYRNINLVSSYEVRFTLKFLFLYFLVFFLMSGNVDRIISLFIINVFTLVTIYFGIKIFKLTTSK